MTVVGALTPEGARIDLDNDYYGVYLQDDWRIGNNLVLNLGVRYDRDSEFDDNDNVAPRIGFAWTPAPKTVVRGSWGLYYDRFRLGLVRNIPDFGGARHSADSGSLLPSAVLQHHHDRASDRRPCASIQWRLTPRSLALRARSACRPHTSASTSSTTWSLPAVLRYRPRRSSTATNILDLSGLSPDEYLARVNASVPLPPGFSWYWGPFGALTHDLLPASEFPVQLDPAFETPHTNAFHLGLQQQFGTHQLVTVDYHHKEIKDILGVRETNLQYISRVPGFERTYAEPFTTVGIRGFGPWFEGEFDAVTVGYTRRMSQRWTLSAHYTYTDATDNLQGSNLGNGAFAGAGGTTSIPNDSFVGTGAGNRRPGDRSVEPRTAPFTASNGNVIAQAGTFHNGPDLDRGNSPLTLEHQFVLFGLVQLPLDFQISAILRATSGFYFSRGAEQGSDPDGNISFGARDLSIEKNSFQAPDYENLDLRVAKFFDIGRVRAGVLVEFFNVFNEQNAASVEITPGRVVPFGQPLQVLPGREGQVGFRLEF